MNDLILGFSVVFQPSNFLACLIGVVIGQVVGILPGLGSVGPCLCFFPLLSILIQRQPLSCLREFTMCAIWRDHLLLFAQYTREATTVVTCIDGHQMAKQGRAGPALGIAAFGPLSQGLWAFWTHLVSKPLSNFWS